MDQTIYDLKIKNSSEVISDLDVDILGLCEVENIDVLYDLNQAFPKRNYTIIHYDSPDNRGIDNALLYDKKRFSIISSKAVPNTLTNGSKREIYFTFLVISKYGSSHLYKSLAFKLWRQRKAIPKRTSTAKLILEEIEKLECRTCQQK